MLIGPDELSPGRTIGIDWRPGAVETLLLAGDETAAPAIASILESLPSDATGVALIEVPAHGDRLDVRAPAGVEVRWLARDGRRAACTATSSCPPCATGSCATSRPSDSPAPPTPTRRPPRSPPPSSDDLPDTPLWDVPEGHSLDGGCYAWLAGEASAITTLRRFLVREAGLDRRQVAFMGYWRMGRAELD